MVDGIIPVVVMVLVMAGTQGEVVEDNLIKVDVGMGSTITGYQKKNLTTSIRKVISN